MPSPNDDWGYDVADYSGVHPDLGTLDDLDELVAEAGARGIRVLLDLVPNHTSDRHPWFEDALRPRRRAPRLLRLGRPGAGRRAAEQLALGVRRPGVDAHEPTGQYYLTTSCRPSPTSTGGTTTCARRSTTSCASGSTAASPASASTSATRSSRTASCATTRRDRRRPPAIFRASGSARGLLDEPPRAARRVAALARARRRVRPAARSSWARPTCSSSSSCVPFYGAGEDELHLAFNFLFVHADLDAAQLRAARRGHRGDAARGAWPVWTGSNHDDRPARDPLGAAATSARRARRC